MRNYLARFLFVLAIVVVFGLSAFGQQTTTGSLNGIVNDPNGAIVAGATVTLKNSETGAERQVTTDSQAALFLMSWIPDGTQSALRRVGSKKPWR